MAHSITLDPPQNQRSPEATMFALVVILVATSLVAGLGALASAGEADPWYAALNKALHEPKARSFFANIGAEALPGSPDDLKRMVRAGDARWGSVIKSLDLRLD